MGRFAFESIKKMKESTQELELSIGPGTADLCLRVKFHSGPTIAGVLRGEKAWFQLFGDTVRIIFISYTNGLLPLSSPLVLFNLLFFMLYGERIYLCCLIYFPSILKSTIY